MVSEVSGQGKAPVFGQQTRTLIGASLAHWVSHIHILTLPPLFPILKEQFGVSYIELGFAVTLFAVVSGITQPPMGYSVDRFGARKILIAGLCLGGFAFMLLGLNPTYTNMLICAVVTGLANSVYHPADYAILSSSIEERRIGRAFSIHTCSGMAGGAMAPAIGLGLALQFDISVALIVMGAFGPLAALIIVLLRVPESETARDRAAKANGKDEKQASVLTPAILALTVFFILLSLSNGGVSTFGIAALQSGYSVSLEAASLTLSIYLGALSIGVLVGGVLADKTRHHGYIAATCFAINAVIFATIAALPMATMVMISALVMAGFLSGLISPSRDMLVRKAAPPGAAGRAFGIVSTGFNIGGIWGPMLFGYILDQDIPRWLFGASAFFMVLTVLLALWTENWSPRKPVSKPS
ncbi:MAG: MFS transporter [Pseudomonadota bacterium]